MIGQRRNAGLAQTGRDVLDLGARQAIDNASIAGMTLGDEGLQLRRPVLLLDDLIADIGTIEARNELRRAGKRQPLDNLLSRQRVRSCRERDARYVGEAF